MTGIPSLRSDAKVSRKRLTVTLAGGSTFISAFLLFVLEPLIAKRILPWFGGSSAVWTVCLVFYQVALLAGYLYASISARYLSRRWQSVLHVSLLTLSLLLLPIGPTAGWARWKPLTQDHPTWLILQMLGTTIGLPFALLSATTPLLQDWLAGSGEDQPYRFFALSNFASLAALLSYPLFFEAHLDAVEQSLWWSLGFVLFTLLCSSFAFQRSDSSVPLSHELNDHHATRGQRAFWFLLSACSAMLLLSITNQINENVAAVPLMWVLPLAVYLVSFIITFGPRAFYRRWLWLRLLAFSLAMMAYASYDITAVLPIQISIPIYLAGLFIGCVFCQGELYELRPGRAHLTDFYLAVAAGGAAGAIFVGLIAPTIFGGIYELPLSFALTGALALLLTWQTGGWGARVLWAGVIISMLAVFVMNWQAYGQNTLALERSFYGSLRVVQSRDARILFHGTVEHGAEYLSPSKEMQPTTYYGPDSGIGILLREFSPAPKKVGIVGLGAGTLAAYGQPGDVFRFYEINPQIVQLSQQYFAFARNSKAQIQIVDGDARLSLERESLQRYDVLVLDAFSGDAIPVHLLTQQAMREYKAHLRPRGALAFHVSNNYLDLAPVVERLAKSSGYRYINVRNREDKDTMVLASEWVIVTNNESVLDNDALKLHEAPLPERSNLRLWTDDFNSLLPILKTPQFR